MAIGAVEYNETGLWLSWALLRGAQWREGKAAEYPEDGRNVRAEKALRAAGEYLRANLQTSAGIKRMAMLVDACRESGVDPLAVGLDVSGLPGVESERVASRYFFDRGREQPDDLTHEELLRDIFVASLHDLNTDHGWDIEPDSTLGKLLRREAVVMDPPPDPAVELMTEIRDLMRELVVIVRGREG
jgi:hypothetical protein